MGGNKFGDFRLRRMIWGWVLFSAFLTFGFTGAYGTDFASWYGPGLYGNATASGNILDPNDWTAASWDYPFGRKLKICSEYACARGVVVTDRGPAGWTGNTIDVNKRVAKKLGIIGAGEAWVTVYDTGNHDPRYLTR